MPRETDTFCWSLTAVTAIPKSAFEEVPSAPGAAITGRRLIVLTRDESLVATLRDVASMGVDIAVVHEDLELITELLGAPASIALIDAAATGGGLEQLVDSLAQQFPDARLLAAGNGLEQSMLATRIASQRVYRFVHKPASAQRLKLFFDAANRPSEATRVSSMQSTEVLRMPVEARAGGTGGLWAPRNKLIAGGVAASIVLVALASWGLKSRPAPVGKTTAVAKTVPIEQLIQRADQAFAQSNFAARDGGSAGELYQQALAAVPEDERARSGYARSVDYALRGVEEALTSGQLDVAEERIDAVRHIAPRNSRLDFLVTQVARERERANADTSRKTSTDARQSQLRVQLDASAEALRRGALLDPIDDSALSHLRAAERLAPADAQVVALRTTLTSRLLAAADASIASGQSAPARRELDAAGILGAETSTLERLRRQADQYGNAAQSKAATPAPAPVAVTAPTPAPATAAAVVAAPPAAEATPAVSAPAAALDATPKKSEPEVISAVNLKRLHSVDPEFPTRALVQGVSGWVDLEFTVQLDGSLRDLMVRASEPRGTFDTVALDAMRRWRFAPFMKDGQAVEQRAWLRMRFTAKDH